MSDVQRLPAEQMFKNEIDALIAAEKTISQQVGKCSLNLYLNIFVAGK